MYNVVMVTLLLLGLSSEFRLSNVKTVMNVYHHMKVYMYGDAYNYPPLQSCVECTLSSQWAPQSHQCGTQREVCLLLGYLV